MEVFILINYKICKDCKLSKPNEDYIGQSAECFRCTYKKKLLEQEIKPVKKSKKTGLCKQCLKIIGNSRRIYCSKECSDESKSGNKHWTQNLKGKNWYDYRRFDFRRTNSSGWGGMYDRENQDSF